MNTLCLPISSCVPLSIGTIKPYIHHLTVASDLIRYNSVAFRTWLHIPYVTTFLIQRFFLFRNRSDDILSHDNPCIPERGFSFCTSGISTCSINSYSGYLSGEIHDEHASLSCTVLCLVDLAPFLYFCSTSLRSFRHSLISKRICFTVPHIALPHLQMVNQSTPAYSRVSRLLPIY